MRKRRYFTGNQKFLNIYLIIDDYKIGSYFGKVGAVEIGFVGLEIDGGDEVIGVPGAPTTFEVGFVGIFEEVLVTAQCCVLTRFFPIRNFLN